MGNANSQKFAFFIGIGLRSSSNVVHVWKWQVRILSNRQLWISCEFSMENSQQWRIANFGANSREFAGQFALFNGEVSICNGKCEFAKILFFLLEYVFDHSSMLFMSLIGKWELSSMENSEFPANSQWRILSSGELRISVRIGANSLENSHFQWRIFDL